MTNDAEHLFMCLLAICIYSLEKCLFKLFTHFKLGYLSFYCWIVRVLYIFWVLDPYISNLQIFSPILLIVFSLLDDVLWSTKSFSFDVVQFTYFSFIVCPFVIPKVVKIYIFSSKSFTVLALLGLWSIHFEVTF